MTDDSYHMPICIGIGVGISIGKIFSSVLGIESIRKKWYRSTFIVVKHTHIYQCTHMCVFTPHKVIPESNDY